MPSPFLTSLPDHRERGTNRRPHSAGPEGSSRLTADPRRFLPQNEPQQQVFRLENAVPLKLANPETPRVLLGEQRLLSPLEAQNPPRPSQAARRERFLAIHATWESPTRQPHLPLFRCTIKKMRNYNLLTAMPLSPKHERTTSGTALAGRRRITTTRPPRQA